MSTEFHISTRRNRYGNDLFIGIFHVMISNFVALCQFLIILKMYINILYVLADASLAPCGSFLKGRGLQNNPYCMSKTKPMKISLYSLGVSNNFMEQTQILIFRNLRGLLGHHKNKKRFTTSRNLPWIY